MTDQPTQEAIDEAATGPAHEFHGIKLHPFSFDRNACWQRCGYEDIESEFEAAVAIVFFCTLGDEVHEIRGFNQGAGINWTGWDFIDMCRGEEKIRAMRKHFGEWCDLHSINANSEDGREANRIGHLIWSEMSVSRFKAKEKAPPGPNV